MPGNMLGRTAPALAAVAVVVGFAAPAAAAPAPPGVQCAAKATVVVKQIPWAQQRLMPERAWVLSRGRGVLVAVIDSGVDATVPQLHDHVLQGIDVINGKGTANTDCVGHGTFVASIIAAQPAAGIGFAGIAPGATILPLRQTNTGQDGTAAVLAAAIRAAADHGAGVVNVSVGSPVPTAALRSAVRYAQAHDVLIVAEAEDQALQGGQPSYPAAYPGVLAVGAIGEDGKRSSSAGAGSDAGTGDFTGLLAPGDGVLGLGTGGPGHLLGQGTSFAVPFVSGVAALVRSYRPKLTAAQVIRRLELTADHTGGALPDPVFGWGVVNPYAAVATVLPQEQPQAAAVPPAGPLPVVHAAPADNGGGRGVGLAIGGLGLAAMLVIGVLAVVVPRGRRRGWRPRATPAGSTSAGRTSGGASGGRAAGGVAAGGTASSSGVSGRATQGGRS
jgi:membrane-anchored mycosin MYCP